jgi:hypothetical protein
MMTPVKTNITPPDPSRLNDPRHWRDKAEEARTKAEEMKDPISRKNMDRVALTYEHLACNAEKNRMEPPKSMASRTHR